jgi:hypothetical protein
MISDRLLTHLNGMAAHVLGWAAVLDEKQRARLANPEIAEEINKLSYLDHWWRRRRIAPLLSKVIERLNEAGDLEQARSWVECLDEELENDSGLREDLVRTFGSEVAFDHALTVAPITPQSTALLGYFEGQAAYGDPRVVIALILFQEWYAITLEKIVRDGAGILSAEANDALARRSEADKALLGRSLSYIDATFEQDDIATLLWSIDFTSLCLREAQAWVATGVLGRRP